MEDERGGLAVEVGAARERVAQVLVARDVGEDPQLDLAVVGGDQRQVRRTGHERAPDPPAERRPDRDVLEVRVRRGEPAGRGHGLVERGVEAAVGGHQGRQRVDVRRAQLGVDPPFEQLVDHRMGRAQVLEDRRVGRVAGLGPLALGQVELEEQDLLELLGTAEIELVPDVDVDLRLEPRDLGGELGGEDPEGVEVERDAGRLHPGQDRDQRQLDLGIEAIETVVDESLLEWRPDRQGGQGLQADAGGAVQLGDRREDQVELLGDHVGDRLAAQRGVEDIRRDLRVEGDRRGRRVRVVGDPRDEERLDLVADHRDRQPVEQASQRRGIVGAFDRDGPPVHAGQGERQGCAAARSRIVEQEPDPDRRLRREPRLEGRDRIPLMDLDPPRVGDRGSERGREVAGLDGRGRDRDPPVGRRPLVG